MTADLPSEPHNTASAADAVARAEALTRKARGTTAYMTVYFVAWALLNIGFAVALWLWAASMPPRGGGPNVFWLFPLLLVYLAGLAALIVWYYRGHTTRPKGGASTVFSVVANAAGWPLGMTLVNAHTMGSSEPLLRGLGFLIGGLLSVALLLVAAIFAARESK